MKKTLIFVILFCNYLVSFGQVDKILIKKETNCDFLFYADSSMIDKTLRLSVFRFYGPIKRRTADKFRQKTNFVREKQYLITDNSFRTLLNEVCLIDKMKIEKIFINYDLNDLTKGHIILDVYFSKIK